MKGGALLNVSNLYLPLGEGPLVQDPAFMKGLKKGEPSYCMGDEWPKSAWIMAADAEGDGGGNRVRYWQNSCVHMLPIGAQVPQLSLQQYSRGPQMFSRQRTRPGSPDAPLRQPQPHASEKGRDPASQRNRIVAHPALSRET